MQDMKAKLCQRCAGSGLEPDQSKTGAKMRQLREGAGVSLRSVADKLKVSAPYLSDLERGNRAWSGERIQQFAGAVADLKPKGKKP